jgi:hypothetical protein
MIEPDPANNLELIDDHQTDSCFIGNVTMNKLLGTLRAIIERQFYYRQ